jgi:hypothetical protein
MATNAQKNKQAEAEAAELAAAKGELAADGTAVGALPSTTEPPVAPDIAGGLTPAVTREPAANPVDTTARRAQRGQRVTGAADKAALDDEAKADAAVVLRCHVDEVLLVEDAHGGNPMVTTMDGQLYELTGDQPGDYIWHQQRPAAVAQIPGR